MLVAAVVVLAVAAVVTVCATTNALQIHIKCLAYNAHTLSVRFSHSKRTFDRRNYKHLIAVTNIFYRNSDQTRLIYCTCILLCVWVCLYLFLLYVSTYATIVISDSSFRHSSPSYQPYHIHIRTHWLFHKYFRHEESDYIFAVNLIYMRDKGGNNLKVFFNDYGSC